MLPSKHSSKPKFECFSCKEIIAKGAYVKAGELYFHQDHFLCEICHIPPGSTYMEKDKKIYCQKDYLDRFAQKCESCHQPLLGKFVNLKEKNYHKECFVCCDCQKPFDDLNFINALQKNWHKECFKCRTCGEMFMDNKYKIMDGYPYHALCK